MITSHLSDTELLTNRSVATSDAEDAASERNVDRAPESLVEALSLGALSMMTGLSCYDLSDLTDSGSFVEEKPRSVTGINQTTSLKHLNPRAWNDWSVYVKDDSATAAADVLNAPSQCTSPPGSVHQLLAPSHGRTKSEPSVMQNRKRRTGSLLRHRRCKIEQRRDKQTKMKRMESTTDDDVPTETDFQPIHVSDSDVSTPVPLGDPSY